MPHATSAAHTIPVVAPTVLDRPACIRNLRKLRHYNWLPGLKIRPASPASIVAGHRTAGNVRPKGPALVRRIPDGRFGVDYWPESSRGPEGIPDLGRSEGDEHEEDFAR